MGFDTEQASYLDFRNILAERSDAVVAWIGAGLSIPAGLPSWRGLRQALVGTLEQLSKHVLDPSEQAELVHCAKSATAETDLWSAFALLRSKLGAEEYRSTVKKALSVSETVKIPEAYRYLWRLRIAGVLNLNLDRLAQKAFTEVHAQRDLVSFTGLRANDYIHILRSQNPWLAYLHGELDDASSWVFTSSELRTLFKSNGYQLLISTCFAARTVIFVGMSADDIAAGGHLESLTTSGIDLGGHFWITHRNDATTRDWAAKAGIRLIHYKAAKEDHSELFDFFNDLQHHVPSDPIPPPVKPTRVVVPSSAVLPTSEDLQKLTAHEIRNVLNSHAASLLQQTNPDTIAQFDAFAKKYSPAIYRAWYVSTEPPDNRISEYTITEQIAEGAFGTVYRAEDSSGRQVAIKVLHEKIRKNREMLHTFRRGVRSMRILSDSGIKGILKFHDASEIPAMVIMDFVEGDDLSQAVVKGVLREWKNLLWVASEVTSIIRHSHKLPQRVLHRDIRPSNIMLENCWGPSSDWENVHGPLHR